jgi:catechol 2,3-dioxygenase-like lactoylglutathione lyase family enzyme
LFFIITTSQLCAGRFVLLEDVLLPKLAVVSLWAEDVATAAYFYRDVIGLKLLMHDQHRSHFDLGGVYLVILQGRPLPPRDPVPARFPIVALAVDDLDAAIDRLRLHRVDLPWGVEEDADSRWVMFHDPAGNLIELAQFKN